MPGAVIFKQEAALFFRANCRIALLMNLLLKGGILVYNRNL